jgi:hypothetical protein
MERQQWRALLLGGFDEPHLARANERAWAPPRVPHIKRALAPGESDLGLGSFPLPTCL